MTLSFSTTWPDRMGDLAGQPNYFIQKIWCGLISNLGDELDNVLYQERHRNKFGYYWRPELDLPPKLHTIRQDPHNRWHPGKKIHPVIYNRSKDRFQFAPTLVCTGVQEIKILNMGDWASECPLSYVIEDDIHNTGFAVYIDDSLIGIDQCEQLAINDGFPSVEAFFRWFNKDFSGKIFHWADWRY